MTCEAFVATSVDGFIATPEGGLDWLTSIEQPGEDFGYQELLDRVDTIVMGRRTWEVVAAFESWPFGTRRCVVLTRRPLVPRAAEQPWSGSVSGLCEHLEQTGARGVYVDGGETIRQFIAAGRLDRLTVSVVPILLGRGIPLFDGTGPRVALALESTRAWECGLSQLRFALNPAG